MLDLILRRIKISFALAAGTAIVVIAVLVYGSIYANTGAELAALYERTAADLAYSFSYKLPEYGTQLASAAGLSDAPLPQAPTAATGTASSIPVLLYHGEGGSSTAMPSSVFVDQMRALKRAGWQTITMAQFAAFMDGTGTLPDKSFLLTFDDGRRDTFYGADPVLRDLGFTAVMFVITGLSLPDNDRAAVNDYYLSQPELSYMIKSGRWELESHGDQDHRGYSVPSAVTTAFLPEAIPDQHFVSNKFWNAAAGRMETDAEYLARITGDLRHSKALLEQDFSIPVTGYAFPFNDFGQETVNYPDARSVLAANLPSLYRFAFYQTWPGDGDTFMYPEPSATYIKRVEPANDWTGAQLLTVLDGGRSKQLPYASNAFGVDWRSNWGSVESGAQLTLSADPDTSGAAAYLDGTESWKAYRISATASVGIGTISLIARHTSTDTPDLVCAFADDYMYLERHEGAAQITLAKARYAPPAVPAARTVSMSVKDNTASCSAYGVSVSAPAGTSVPAHGGIGVSVWDPENGAAQAAVSRISVSAL